MNVSNQTSFRIIFSCNYSLNINLIILYVQIIPISGPHLWYDVCRLWFYFVYFLHTSYESVSVNKPNGWISPVKNYYLQQNKNTIRINTQIKNKIYYTYLTVSNVIHINSVSFLRYGVRFAIYNYTRLYTSI